MGYMFAFNAFPACATTGIPRSRPERKVHWPVRTEQSYKTYNTNTNIKQNHKVRNTNTKLYNTNIYLEQNHKIRNTNTKLYKT